MDKKKKSFGKNLKQEAQTVLDKTKAKAQEAKGVMKEAVGKATGDTKMKAEGQADKAIGKAKGAVADTKDAVRDAAETIRKDLHKKH
jgi:uncharacterized protein YjbJ (UPF0337 family)